MLTAEDGTGVLEDNDIFDNQWSGRADRGPPQTRSCGTTASTTTAAPASSPTRTARGSSRPTRSTATKSTACSRRRAATRRCALNRIHDKVYGIYLTESGGGIYEENRIHNIRGTGIYVSADRSPVSANNNHGTV